VVEWFAYLVLSVVAVEFAALLFIFVFYILPPLQYLPQIYQEVQQIRQAIVG